MHLPGLPVMEIS
jgi:hypothetical protein